MTRILALDRPKESFEVAAVAAIANILLDITLIPMLGITGAAVATLLTMALILLCHITDKSTAGGGMTSNRLENKTNIKRLNGWLIWQSGIKRCTCIPCVEADDRCAAGISARPQYSGRISGDGAVRWRLPSGGAALQHLAHTGSGGVWRCHIWRRAAET